MEFDFGATPTSPSEGFLSSTMALARGLDNFYLADGSVMLSTHEYLWPRAKIVPVSTSIGSTDNHETALLSPGIDSTEKTTSASMHHFLDAADAITDGLRQYVASER